MALALAFSTNNSSFKHKRFILISAIFIVSADLVKIKVVLFFIWSVKEEWKWPRLFKKTTVL